MSSLKTSMESKFNELKVAISQDKGKWPSSQGVNALLMVYPPNEEKKYLERVREEYSSEYIIDLSELFLKFIDIYGLEDFKEMYKNFRSTSVFIDDSSTEEDLLDLILYEIEEAISQNKTPVIIRTGILYGTGIRNNDILESNVVKKCKQPLLIFYPGEVSEDLSDNERIYFLGVVKASDYRGHFI